MKKISPPAKSTGKRKKGMTENVPVMVNCLLKAEPEKSLSPQHDRFCREFIIDENAVRAYQRAYPNSGYESARVSACELLAKPNVQDRIQELREERNKRLDISADRVLAELAKLAFYDPRNLFDDDGRLKTITEMDADAAAVIAGIESTHKIVGEDKDGIAVLTKIKLPDKKSALELIGRSLAMWKDVGSKENPAEMVHRVERVMVRPPIENTKD